MAESSTSDRWFHRVAPRECVAANTTGLGEAARAIRRADFARRSRLGYDSRADAGRESLRAAAVRVAPLLDRLTPARSRPRAQPRRRQPRVRAAILRAASATSGKRRPSATSSGWRTGRGSLTKAQVDRVAPTRSARRCSTAARSRPQAAAGRAPRHGARARVEQAPARPSPHYDRGRDPAYTAASRRRAGLISRCCSTSTGGSRPTSATRALAELRRYPTTSAPSPAPMNEPAPSADRRRCAPRPPSSYAGRTRYTQLEYEALLANPWIGIAFTRERRFFLCTRSSPRCSATARGTDRPARRDRLHQPRKLRGARADRRAGPLAAGWEPRPRVGDARRKDGSDIPRAG